VPRSLVKQKLGARKREKGKKARGAFRRAGYYGAATFGMVANRAIVLGKEKNKGGRRGSQETRDGNWYGGGGKVSLVRVFGWCGAHMHTS